MPSGSYPVLSHRESYLVVQLQRLNRSAPTCGASYNPYSIFTPVEVAVPLLRPGVEKKNPAVICGVVAMGFCALCIVAKTACEPEILFAVVTTSRGRDDMLNLKDLQHVTL
jgi:hypothetical protein